jgi:hypothetical protein
MTPADAPVTNRREHTTSPRIPAARATRNSFFHELALVASVFAEPRDILRERKNRVPENRFCTSWSWCRRVSHCQRRHRHGAPSTTYWPIARVAGWHATSGERCAIVGWMFFCGKDQELVHTAGVTGVDHACDIVILAPGALPTIGRT